MRTEEQPCACHVVGSAVSHFYYDLSVVYATDVIKPPGWRTVYLIVQPDGRWCLGPTLAELSDAAPPPAIMAQLDGVDLIVPHMFCLPGMTTYRALFEDVLGLPVVGSPSSVTAIAADKAWTRQIMAAAGVGVARGGLIDGTTVPDLTPPFIVKPCREDNSLGLSLVRDMQEADAAIATARQYDTHVLAEDFIDGREIRCAVIETGDTVWVPPMIEYAVSDDRPIRTLADKLDVSEAGTPRDQATTSDIGAICPAVIEEDLRAKIEAAAISAHHTLGARHYSLFDFRIDRTTQQPVLLEAGLFWSFSTKSMITRMIAAGGIDPVGPIDRLWRAALDRSARPNQ